MMTDDELADALEAITVPIGETELRRRQLGVLRGTYPAWDIWQGPDPVRGPWWVAQLRRQVTEHMRRAGVRRRVETSDATELASALAMQVALIHNSRVAP
ncbi:hypothetical protein AB0K40_17640 [Nonomuraea bangladeshensis]|uniref:Uncharacterized protein n=1 Tax=Nonomuraea bangladeshensis TaxID=404385 RepID=A0ABV3H4G0_9ACTN